MSQDLDQLKDNPYLLDDDDMLAMLEAEYKKEGSPVDQVGAARNWKQIEEKISPAQAKPTPKKSKKGWYQAASIVAAAALLFIVFPRNQAPDLGVKSGETVKITVFLNWDGSTIDFRTDGPTKQAAIIGLNSSGAYKIWEGELGSTTKVISTPSDSPYDQVCLLYSQTTETLTTKVELAISNWQDLALEDCVKK